MTAVDRMTSLTSQLVGDIGRLPGVQLDAVGEAQLVQLLTDAMEVVGHIALDTEQQSGDYQPCRCGEYQTCSTCIEAHRRFQQVSKLNGPIAADGPYQGFHLQKCFDSACQTDHYSP